MRVRVVLQVVLIAIAFGAALAAWLPFTSLGGAADDAAASSAAPPSEVKGSHAASAAPKAMAIRTT